VRNPKKRKRVNTLKKQIAEIEARPEITPKKKKNGGSPTKRIKKMRRASP
jgi:hypothetical protein